MGEDAAVNYRIHIPEHPDDPVEVLRPERLGHPTLSEACKASESVIREELGRLRRRRDRLLARLHEVQGLREERERTFVVGCHGPDGLRTRAVRYERAEDGCWEIAAPPEGARRSRNTVVATDATGRVRRLDLDCVETADGYAPERLEYLARYERLEVLEGTPAGLTRKR